MTFDQMIKNLAIHIREDLQQLEELHSLSFSIDITGRVHDGDLKVKFQIGSSYNEGGVVKGASLDAVLTEYKRRFGWDKRNAPICLGFDGTSTDDEIPF